MTTNMLTVRSVLCPVDFSDESRQALLWASAIAEQRGAEMTVLSVVEPLLAQAAGIRFGLDLTRPDADPALRDFVEATLPGRMRRPLHFELAAGDPSNLILQTARRVNAGLVVMGTHGRGGVRKLLLGSTTEQVLRGTKWPVLAVPRGAPAVEPAGVQLKKILLATDFRETAMGAAQCAAELASCFDVPLVLAHVVEPVLVPPQWQLLVADFESDSVAAGQRKLARLSTSLGNMNSDCVVSVGPPADTIASMAVERGADLVVMGLANPEDSEQRRPGSIAYRVLRLAHVPVVVVPALPREARPTGQPAGALVQSDALRR